MTRPATRTLSTVLAAAMAVGVLLLAAAWAGAVTGSSGHKNTAAPTAQRINPGELRRLLDQIVAAGAPGAAARVRDEQGVTQAASGVADLRSGRPMRPWLHYRVGSLTKPFVATVVLQLVAEGRLSLQDTVERWLPGILAYGDQVTVRQLLNHTGGVPDYEALVLPQLYESKRGRFRSWTPRELVALVADQPPDFPPGTAWSYSNTGYVLAGMIVEAATGHTLGRELARRILRPLGLRDTFFPVNAAGIPGPRSRGYSPPLGQQDGPLLDFTVLNPSVAWAAGNLISNLADLERFFRALLRGRLLPPRLLAAMLTPVPTGRPGLGWGLGLLVVDTPAGRLVGHDGAIPGFYNFVVSTEDGRRQAGVMVNVWPRPPAVAEAFDQVFMTLALGLLQGAPPAVASTSTAQRAAVQVASRHVRQGVLARAGMAVQAQR
jgi:D-alanyl-D-alanine carboxypeptidase